MNTKWFQITLKMGFIKFTKAIAIQNHTQSILSAAIKVHATTPVNFILGHFQKKS
jgi:hypothetical protein